MVFRTYSGWDTPPPNSCCAATSALLQRYNHCRVFPQSHIIVAHARSPHYALMHRLDVTGRGSFLWRAWICPQEEETNAVAQDPSGVARLSTPTCVCHVRPQCAKSLFLRGCVCGGVTIKSIYCVGDATLACRRRRWTSKLWRYVGRTPRLPPCQHAGHTNAHLFSLVHGESCLLYFII